jgi:DNA-binding NtrC family response regulator
VNVRIIAATNVDLAERVSQGSFLPDLSARLAMWKVVIPPLRERRADIPGLVEEMLTRHAGSCGYGDCPPAVNPRLMEAIVRAEWPDNLRQLEGAVHRLMLLAEGAPELTLAHCDDVLSFLCDHVSPADIKREQALQALEAERSYLGAARRLGVDPKTVRRRLRED